MLMFPFDQISAQIKLILAEICPKGNTNIKYSLYRICDMDKKHTDKN